MCEEFHLSVMQALQALALPDLDEFEAADIADECAGLMFEVMELRSFAGAMRAYKSAKPEEHQKMANEDDTVKLVMEIDYEMAGERLRVRKAQAEERKRARLNIHEAGRPG